MNKEHALELLKESEEKYRAILEQSADSIYLLDFETKRVIEANESLQKLLGYSEEELTGLTVYDFVHHSHDNIDTKIAEVLKKKHILLGERIYKRKDGMLIHVDVSASLISYRGKKSLSIVSRDISERKKIKQEKERLQQLFMEIYKMESIARLAGGVAHEFNNLLTGIIGFSELLLMQVSKKFKHKDLIENIKKEATEAAKLSRQLLSFSRKQESHFRNVNLNSLIKRSKSMLKHLLAENIELSIVLEKEPNKIIADPEHIEQIIVNLVLNANDAMPDGGQLTIKTKNVELTKSECKSIPNALPGNYLCFSIYDTGYGIDKELIHRIFEPFFTTKMVGKRAGMGLSVVYGIVKEHKAFMDITTEKEKGTEFRIYFPAFTTEFNDSKPFTSSFTDSKNLMGKRILLVEDEKIVRKVIAITLKENGYVVLEASNAAQARKLFKKEKGNFDLIFTDVVMPGENGVELVENLLIQKHHPKVLFSSGYTNDKAKKNIIENRGYSFIQKPYTISDMLDAVKNTIL